MNRERTVKIDNLLRKRLGFVPLKYYWFDNNSVRIKVRKVSTLRRIEELIKKSPTMLKEYNRCKVLDVKSHYFLDILHKEDDNVFITYHT